MKKVKNFFLTLKLIHLKKITVSIGATLIDGIVLARSAFHHSVNYRSVVIFSTAELVTDETELYTALGVFTEKMCPGRWNDIRQPNAKEWKATMVLSFKITLIVVVVSFAIRFN